MTEANFIIHEHARQYQWEGECFLSVKSFYQGSVRYQVRQREYVVNERNYLILNDCTNYRLTIDTSSDTESFCVFFSPDFVSRLLSEAHATHLQLLDFSARKVEGIRLIERNYHHEGRVSALLNQGRRLLSHPEFNKEEYYYALLNAILCQNETSQRETANLAFVKKTTREEVYRRICFARDFMEAEYTQGLTLKRIAEVAMLSENHLLRNFKRIFHTSPFRYIARLRLEEAKKQLAETDRGITEIAVSLGYSSMSNFSDYFRKIVGYSPAEYRMIKR